MSKHVEAGPTAVEGRIGAFAQTVVKDGRDLASQLPEVASGARDVLSATQRGLDHLSDGGIVAAMAVSTGFAAGLLVAGAPRLVLALALIPMGIVSRSLLTRGVGPASLFQ